jgi:hypothetical protein
MGFETIASDLGISYLGNIFNGDAKPDEIPFDSVWLSIFKGEADPTLYGPPFTNIENLANTFAPVYQSRPIESIVDEMQGAWYFSLWNKRSVNEFEKVEQFKAIQTREDYEKFLLE